MVRAKIVQLTRIKHLVVTASPGVNRWLPRRCHHCGKMIDRPPFFEQMTARDWGPKAYHQKCAHRVGLL